MKLFQGDLKSNATLMKDIQLHMPLFFDVLISLQVENCLPGEWKGLMIDLIDLALSPFSKADIVTTARADSSDEICR